MKSLMVLLSLVVSLPSLAQQAGGGVEIPRNAKIPIVLDDEGACGLIMALSTDEVRSAVEKVFSNHGLEPAPPGGQRDYHLLIHIDTLFAPDTPNGVFSLDLQFKRSVVYKVRGKDFSLTATTYATSYTGRLSDWPPQAVLIKLQNLVRMFSVEVVKSWQ